MTTEDYVKNREHWSSQADFVLASLGCAVGLGNVWRFPWLCGKFGGAAFMIPYFVMMTFAGLPMYYLEMAIGQFAGLTPQKLFKRMCPLFGGIGYAMLVAALIGGVTYNMVIAWGIRYFVASFSFNGMPWEGCDKPWNTERCFDKSVYNLCDNTNLTHWYFKGECLSVRNQSVGGHMQQDIRTKMLDSKFRKSPAQEYNDQLLRTSNGLGEIGYPKWDLVLSLLFAWLIVFLCLIRGIKSSGKVVYFTALFPYVILTILLVRGVTLPGASRGIYFYLVPDWQQMAKPAVWVGAAMQIFYSLGIGCGQTTTLASYNTFNNNMLRDTLIVVFGNCGTSVYAGFVIFSVIGFIAEQTGEPVAASGPTLAFVAYPSALAKISPSWFWSILFFFMIILLGIDSQIVIVEVAVTSICDNFTQLRTPFRKACVVAVICVISFLCGIILTCPAGPYILTLGDNFNYGFTIILAGLIEVCMVSWIYGIRRFIKDLDLMMGKAPSAFWRLLGYPSNWFWWITWAGVTPVLVLAIMVSYFANYTNLTYGDYVYPWWGELIGWCICMASLVWVPVIGIQRLVTGLIKFGVDRTAVRFTFDLPAFILLSSWLLNPTPDWAPASAAHALTYNTTGKNLPTNGAATNPGFAFDTEKHTQNTRF